MTLSFTSNSLEAGYNYIITDMPSGAASVGTKLSDIYLTTNIALSMLLYFPTKTTSYTVYYNNKTYNLKDNWKINGTTMSGSYYRRASAMYLSLFKIS